MLRASIGLYPSRVAEQALSERQETLKAQYAYQVSQAVAGQNFSYLPGAVEVGAVSYKVGYHFLADPLPSLLNPA
jgi:hypothetical protein